MCQIIIYWFYTLFLKSSKFGKPGKCDSQPPTWLLKWTMGHQTWTGVTGSTSVYYKNGWVELLSFLGRSIFNLLISKKMGNINYLSVFVLVLAIRVVPSSLGDLSIQRTPQPLSPTMNFQPSHTPPTPGTALSSQTCCWFCGFWVIYNQGFWTLYNHCLLSTPSTLRHLPVGLGQMWILSRRRRTFSKVEHLAHVNTRIWTHQGSAPIWSSPELSTTINSASPPAPVDQTVQKQSLTWLIPSWVCMCVQVRGQPQMSFLLQSVTNPLVFSNSLSSVWGLSSKQAGQLNPWVYWRSLPL